MRISGLFSISLALFSLLTLASCNSKRAGWRSALARGWSESDYRLSQTETSRLKTESQKAQQNGNREVCGGILSGPDGSLHLCFANNESRHPHSYQLSSRSVRRMEKIAQDTNSVIIGAFHSHPSSDATPGPDDLEHAAVHSLMLIHSVPTSRTRLWKVVLRDGEKKAREMQLEVIGQRLRGASPLAPSPTAPVKDGSPRHDIRSR